MAIYFILLLLTFIAAIFPQRKRHDLIVKRIKQHEIIPLIYYFFLFSLVFIGAFRGLNVGTDLHGSYLEKYRYITLNPETWDYGPEMESAFCYFMAYIKHTFHSYHLFYGLLFVSHMIGVHFIIKRYSSNGILTLFFFIILLHFTWAFNIMRQALVISLIVFIFPLLERPNLKKLLIYEFVIIVMSFGFHRTCIVYTLFPLLVTNICKEWFEKNRKLIIGLLLISLISMLLTNRILTIIPRISDYLTILGDRYVMYGSNLGESKETKSFLTAVLQTSFAIYLISIVPKKLLRNLFLITFVLGTAISNFLGSFSVLFVRVSACFLFFDMILFTNLWYVIPSNKRDVYRVVVVIYALIIFTNSMIKGFGQVVPYTNWLIDSM